MIDDGKDLAWFGIGREAFVEFGGMAVEQGAVGVEIGFRKLRLREEEDALFEIEFFAVVAHAEAEKTIIGVALREVVDDFVGAAAEDRVAA